MTFVTAFATPRNVPTRQALTSWNECVSQYLTELDITLAKEEHFSASIEVSDIGYLRFADPCSTASRVSHTRSCVSRANGDSYLLHLQVGGYSSNQQSGHEAILKPGDFTLCDTSRPYRLDFDAKNKILVIVIPKQALKQRLADPELYTCIPMMATSCINRITSEMLLSVWSQSKGDDPPAPLGNKLAGNILDLLATSYGSLNHTKVEESSVVSARRIMIRDFIEQYLSEPELSPTYIAKALKYNVSYLHELFRGEGESISRYIMRRRLEASAKALSDPQLSGISISQIAYQWGFKNTTHFGRLFKQHFGHTPGEYRLGTSK